MTGSLASLPLPMLAFLLSAVALALVLRSGFATRRARSLFAGFFGLIAVGTFLVGLRFGYGVERFIFIQRGLPLFAGPLLYLGFAMLWVPTGRQSRVIAMHLGGALSLAVLLPLMFDNWSGLDLVIGLSYLSYAIALAWVWSKGANHLVHARIGTADVVRRWMLLAVLFLVVSLCVDSAIAISFALEQSDSAMQLISYGSLGLIASLLITIVGVSSRGAAPATPLGEPVSQENSEAVELEEKARALLLSSQLYLDTELSVERLAKRLHVPARSLSSAINQTQGMNVSQYVNGFRLDHAADLLRRTDTSVVQVMAQSGFLTRSNFYREFQNRFGETPTSYRQSR